MLEKLQNLLGSKSADRKSNNDTEKEQYIEYAVALEQGLRKLESGVHESDDPNEIVRNVLRCACDFYQGDWVGFLEVDMELALWTPVVWYNPNPDDKTLNLLQEFESAEFLHRWVKAMNENTAIIIEDMDEVRKEYPAEHKVLEGLYVETCLAVPVKPRPVGFLVVRNPKRYINRGSMLQMLAFVVLSCINESKFLKGAKMSLSPESIEHDTDIIINLFGNLSIYTSNGVLRESDLKSPKICRMLAYMLINRKSTIPPREIAEAIWPEEAFEADIPGNNIRGLIFRLRQAFSLVSEHQLVETTPNGYRFNPELNIMTDMQQFDRLWDAAQKAGSTSAKVEILKQAMDLYKGDVLLSADSEHWLTLTASHYNVRYIGVTNELLRTLSDAKDYHNLHKYAAQSLNVVPTNPKAYYWMIYAMFHLGSPDMAYTELQMAERNLLEEEYDELVRLVKQIDVKDVDTPFRNERIHQK